MTYTRRARNLAATQIAAVYLISGVLWIIITDGIVLAVATSQTELTTFQTAKGWLFVLGSAGLLYALVSEREHTITAERKFTELALDSLTDVFVVLTPDARLSKVNERASAVSGYSEDELLEMDPEQLFEDDWKAVSDAISSAYETGSASVEATLVTRDGSEIRYEFSGKRMDDADGEVRGLAVVGRDITERVLNAQRLDVAHRVLRHNLRNELTVVRGLASSIAGGEGRSTGDVDAQRSQTDARSSRGDDPPSDHQRAASIIVDTVDALIDTSKKTRAMAELGSDQSAHSTIDIRNTIEKLCEEFADANPDATIEVDMTVESGAEGTAVVPRGRECELALRNLLENAIEHNPEPNPWIRVEVEPTPDDVCVRIHDDGPGIPENEYAALEAGLETPLAHGSGVGLWLVHWCVTLVGGQLAFDDREPAGSVVTMTLPTVNAR